MKEKTWANITEGEWVEEEEELKFPDPPKFNPLLGEPVPIMQGVYVEGLKKPKTQPEKAKESEQGGEQGEAPMDTDEGIAEPSAPAKTTGEDITEPSVPTVEKVHEQEPAIQAPTESKGKSKGSTKGKVKGKSKGKEDEGLMDAAVDLEKGR